MADCYFKNNTTQSLYDANNWYSDAECSTPINTVPNFATDNITIGTNTGTAVVCDVDASTIFAMTVTITPNGTMSISSTYFNVIATFNGPLVISSGGVFNITNTNSAALYNTMSNIGIFSNNGSFDCYGPGVINNYSVINNYGSFTCAGLTTLNNNGSSFYNYSPGVVTIASNSSFINDTGGYLAIYSDFNNYGTINNIFGNIFNYGGPFTSFSIFNNQANGVFTNSAIYSDSGIFTNYGAFTNTSTVDIMGQLNNSSALTNNGIITLADGSVSYNYAEFTNNNSVINNAGGIFYNYYNFYNYANAALTNNGVFWNINKFFNYQGSSVINSDTFYNNADFSNQSDFTNNAVFNNNGTLLLDSTGNFINNGNFYNYSILSMHATAAFTNKGALKTTNSYTTSFKGSVFPQIPSSAAFGTALIF